MIKLELPPLPAGTWLGVIIERHAVAGVDMVAVTVRSRAGQAVRREWFSESGPALAWAASRADDQHLPIFDLRDPGA